MSKEPCAGCGLPFTGGKRAHVYTAAGNVMPTRVCMDCAARGVLLVVEQEERKHSRASLRPFIDYFRTLGLVYRDGRGVGLEQAADILESGRMPALGQRDDEAPKPPPKTKARVEVTKAASNGVHPVRSEPSELGHCALALIAALRANDQPLSRGELAVRSVYSVESGGFAGALSQLREKRLLAGRGTLELTPEGRSLPAELPTLPRGADLVLAWCERLDPCPSTLLRVLSGIYPKGLSRRELAERAGYSEASGGYAGGLSRLRSLGLANGRGELFATKALMGAPQ